MSDAHPQGGKLEAMAKEGTKVPGEAAKPNVVPSSQGQEQQSTIKGAGVGREEPRPTLDQPALDGSGMPEVISAAGGDLPEDVGQKYSRHGGKERGHHPTPHGGRNLPSH
ncbi:hypothetical protein VTJ49DRAFT_3107 [Mycothermus thermophilus]|uniref:Uncharacterized protein n=1 Tax=Humicola insolens TaxID=85995 RepID=A0ABR3V8B6_HUMIN